jgi:hypothetical protein
MKNKSDKNKLFYSRVTYLWDNILFMVRAFSPIDVLHLFQKNNKIFTNREGLTLEMPAENIIRVTTSLRVPCQEEHRVPMQMRVCHYGLYPFLNAYRINP